MRTLKVFVLGILAGISIALGGCAFIACKSIDMAWLGAVLFPVGLLLVCSFGFKLFTGQIGYVFEKKDKVFCLDLFIMCLGNIVGAAVLGVLFWVLFKDNSTIMNTVTTVSSSKLLNFDNLNSIYELLISGIFCGMLVYVAVAIFKHAEAPVVKVIGLMFAITTFVIAGFAHCIANVFYFAASLDMFLKAPQALLGFLIVLLGNSIGAIILNTLFVFVKDQLTIKKN